MVQQRYTGQRIGGRSEQVAIKVLQATGEELCRVGYAAMRVEDIAALSGVNKTSIYRRWPSKADLVKAAITELRDHTPNVDTGSLREDLRTTLVGLVKLARAPKWQGLILMFHSKADPEVEKLAEAMRDEEETRRIEIIQRGIDRGDLPAGVDPRLLADMVTGPIMRRLLTFGELVDEDYVDAVLDTALAGLRATTEKQATPAESDNVSKSRRARARTRLRAG